MDDQAELAEHFDRSRAHLRAVAYRMLGSADEADDAVQETWLRACRDGAGAVVNLRGWLTTIVSHICLDMLRSRRHRREEFMDLAELDLEVAHDAPDPADEAELADSVGVALLVVLDTLGPAERVAFVLHDLFAVPFADIARIVERSPDAAKKLASRARHRVLRGTTTMPASDLARQRDVVEAFLSASRAGDLAALLEVLAPDVIRRVDTPALAGDGGLEVRGAHRVAEETAANARRAAFARLALVNGAVGAIVAPRGRLLLVLEFVVRDGRVAEMNVIAEPARLGELELAVLDWENTDDH